MTDLIYKGFKIQKTYAVINCEGEAIDYFFTLTDAKKCVNAELKKEQKT